MWEFLIQCRWLLCCNLQFETNNAVGTCAVVTHCWVASTLGSRNAYSQGQNDCDIISVVSLRSLAQYKLITRSMYSVLQCRRSILWTTVNQECMPKITFKVQTNHTIDRSTPRSYSKDFQLPEFRYQTLGRYSECSHSEVELRNIVPWGFSSETCRRAQLPTKSRRSSETEECSTRLEDGESSSPGNSWLERFTFKFLLNLSLAGLKRCSGDRYSPARRLNQCLLRRLSQPYLSIQPSFGR